VATSPSEWQEQASRRLRAGGSRQGSAREAVLELLAETECCLTALEVFDELRARGRRVGLASVYRALDLLTDKGLVQRIELGGRTARFERLLPSGDHHHHLVCDDCGKIEAFEDPELERALHRAEGRSGFSVAAHDVLLHGACADCRSV
jgi:Fur family transcriptional regulator, ferric uptake regulator